MIVTTTHIPGLPEPIRGKVRDVYDLGDTLLMVATDRLSAFDVVLPTGIPDKGRVLTQMSLFWFKQTSSIIENHLISANIDDILAAIGKAGATDPQSCREMLAGRTMVTKKAVPSPIECVVRGYLAGSAWNEYKALCAGSVGDDNVVLHGIELPNDMVESQQLPEPVFTPATKESTGHDVNISAEHARRIVGQDMGMELEESSISIYLQASEYAAHRGIIICDTKFEFGVFGGKLILIDEVLTPDSSRFWDAASYVPGRSQPSYDKQFVRDYLLTLDWDQTYPGPVLPEEIAAKTAEKYREAYRLIVGQELP